MPTFIVGILPELEASWAKPPYRRLPVRVPEKRITLHGSTVLAKDALNQFIFPVNYYVTVFVFRTRLALEFLPKAFR